MSNEAPTDALRLVPTRDDGLRVGRAILEAHSQWEKEHGVTGAQNPWQEQHIILLGQAAILAAPASPLPEGGGWQDVSTAPKDGTPLLAGSIHHSDPEVVCWQDGLPSGSMDTDAEWEGWVNDGPQKDRFYANPRYFTHWMPLPAAPTGAA